MKEYVLDTNAVVRYVLGQNGAEKVEALLRQSAEGRASICMSAVNAGEVYYVMMHHSGETSAAKAVRGLGHVISYMPAGLEEAIEAAKLKERYKLGYADSFAAALAIRVSGILVSADPAFGKLGKSIQLLKLPRYVEN